MRVVDLGSRLQVTNRTDRDVVVLGYVGEPYLKIGPSGVYENLHCQATYINRTRNGGTIPPDVDTSPTAAPDWKKISDGHSASFHDHRIHWMSQQAPPQVASDPNSFHRLSVQHVTLIHEPDQKIDVTVALEWVPGPSGWPWIPVAVALFVLAVFAAMRPAVGAVPRRSHRIRGRGRRGARHRRTRSPAPERNVAKTLQFLGGGFVTVAVWVAAGFTIIGVLRRRSEALYGVIFVGAMVALVGGATDLSSLWKSQLPNVGPVVLTRLEVAISLGVGAGLVVGALIRIIRTNRTAKREVDRGRWLSLLVSDLSDTELERIALDLDADDVLEAALSELAHRVAPVVDGFADGALVFDVQADTLRGTTAHVWSLEQIDPTSVHATRGRSAVVGAELRTRFPVLLRILAGAVALDDATADGRVVSEGDPVLLQRVAPYLPEDAVPTPVTSAPDDRASAS